MKARTNIITSVISLIYLMFVGLIIAGNMYYYDIFSKYDVSILCIVLGIPLLIMSIIIPITGVYRSKTVTDGKYTSSRIDFEILITVPLLILGIASRVLCLLGSSNEIFLNTITAYSNSDYDLYTGLISLVFRYIYNDIFVVVLINIILSILSLIFLYVFVRILTGATAGIAAIILYSLSPVTLIDCVNYSPELLYSLIIIAFFMVYAIIFKRFSNVRNYHYISIIIPATIIMLLYRLNYMYIYTDDIIPAQLWNNFVILQNPDTDYNVFGNVYGNELIVYLMPLIERGLLMLICMLSLVAVYYMIRKRRSLIQLCMLLIILSMPFTILCKVNYGLWYTIYLLMITIACYGLHNLLTNQPKEYPLSTPEDVQEDVQEDIQDNIQDDVQGDEQDDDQDNVPDDNPEDITEVADVMCSNEAEKAEEETVIEDIPEDFNIYESLPVPKAVRPYGEPEGSFIVKDYTGDMDIDSEIADAWGKRKQRIIKRYDISNKED